MYIVTYQRRSDRDTYKWVEFQERLGMAEVIDLLRFLKKKGNYTLVSVVDADVVEAADQIQFKEE